MKTPTVPKFTIVVFAATLAGGVYVLAAPQAPFQRPSMPTIPVPQAQAPGVDVPSIFGRPRSPLPAAQKPAAMPVMSDELTRAYVEASQKHLDYLPGRVIVKFRSSANVADQARALSSMSGNDRPLTGIEYIGDFAVVKDSSGIDARVLAARLAQQPEVEYAEPDYLLHPDATPNDPSYGTLQWNFSLLSMPRAWDVSPGGDSNLIVAVVDSGITSIAAQTMNVSTWDGSAIVSYGLPVGPSTDFSLGRFVLPRDFTISASSPSSVVIDTDGHGTHVAGTIGENTNNGIALAGIAYNVKIMPLKACTSFWDRQFAMSGNGQPGFASGDTSCSSSATAAAIRFAADNGARVLNYSLGSTNPNTVTRDAMAYAISKGVFIAMSNGNEFNNGNPTTYPASYGPGLNGAMAVAAIVKSQGKASYSSTGSWTEISAPGGGSGDFVYQTTLIPSDSDQLAGVRFPRFDRYAMVGYTGTSMASPHVAGLAALITSRSPSITPAQVEQVIKVSARELGTTGRDDTFGYGLIQPRAALFGQGIR